MSIELEPKQATIACLAPPSVRTPSVLGVLKKGSEYNCLGTSWRIDSDDRCFRIVGFDPAVKFQVHITGHDLGPVLYRRLCLDLDIRSPGRIWTQYGLKTSSA